MEKFNIKNWQDKKGHKRTLGQINEVSNYIHMERTVTLKDMKGKTVTLRKGMTGTHVRYGWDEDVMTFGNHKFDASPGGEWGKKVKRDDISVS